MATTATPTTTVTTTAAKPGYKTSEFWLTVAAFLVSALFMSGVIPSGGIWPTALGYIALALTSAGYQVTRSLTKGAASAAHAAVVSHVAHSQSSADMMASLAQLAAHAQAQGTPPIPSPVH